MSAYRKYYLDNCIVAERRDQRPHIGKDSSDCPFCLSNESKIEQVIDEVWEDEALLVRIIPNKYPIARPEGLTTGYHDVVIDTGEHLKMPKDFSLHHWKVLLLAIQRRWHKLSEDEQIAFIQVFKNKGQLAGASIYHSHWQIVALAKVPFGMRIQYDYYHHKNKLCFLCEKMHLLEARLIKETALWRMIVPPEPSFLYEVWFIPKRHVRHYGELVEEEIEELGAWMKKLLQVYEALSPECAYNICFMSGDLKQRWQYHFHIKLMMRMDYIAGFEIATRCTIHHRTIDEYAFQIKKLLDK